MTEPADASPQPAVTEPAAMPGADELSPHEGAAGHEPVWRRAHGITPFLKAWRTGAAIVAFVAWQFTRDVDDLRAPGLMFALAILAAIAIGALGGLLFGTLAWRRLQFHISENAVVVRSGVVFRQEREARLDRVQGIDITQPLLARLFGFAALTIDSAGGADSKIELSYLTQDQAQRLRNEILARAAGLEIGAPMDGVPREAPQAPERLVYRVEPGMLLGSIVRSGGMLASVLASIAVVGALVGRFVEPTLATLFWVVPAALGAASYVWGRFRKEYGFSAAISPDGIRVRSGMTERTSRTLPPGRIQAIGIRQPLLWRRKDWWRVEVNVAAHSAGEDSERILLPVGVPEHALAALWLALPELNAPDDIAAVRAGMHGSGQTHGWTTSPRRARWIDPLAWRRNGFRLTAHALLTRRGRWIRSVQIVPHQRTQALKLEAGPLQRKMDVVTFTACSTDGPVSASVPHLDRGLGMALIDEQAQRARAARQIAGPEQWMRVVAPDLVIAHDDEEPTAFGEAEGRSVEEHDS